MSRGLARAASGCYKPFNRAASALQLTALPRLRPQRATRLIMWRSLLACVFTVIAPIAAAQVFECTNAAGVKQYADFCPAGTVQRRQIGKGESGTEVGATKPAGAGAAPKSIELQDAEFRQRTQQRQEAETKAAQEQARAEESERNCLEARTQLQSVEDGQRLQRYDPVTGERINFGDEDRAVAAETQRQAIARWCK